ncbi:CDP-alcohol phosphatidyltransferase [Clostridia bacterium]|nr:CDP-alcohol phosphatidyltransferase [Clostridia bacterium]
MKHIPNILSFLRILLIPFFVWQMNKGNTFNAAVILCASGLTDMLDGALARGFNWITQLGKVLDPVADKLTQVTVCVVFAIKYRIYWYFFAALLFKDLVMLLLGGYLVKNKIRMEGARWFGKVVTTFFYVTTVSLVFFPGIPHWAKVALLTTATVSAFAAGILYIPQFIKYRRDLKARTQ